MSDVRRQNGTYCSGIPDITHNAAQTHRKHLSHTAHIEDPTTTEHKIDAD